MTRLRAYPLRGGPCDGNSIEAWFAEDHMTAFRVVDSSGEIGRYVYDQEDESVRWVDYRHGF